MLINGCDLLPTVKGGRIQILLGLDCQGVKELGKVARGCRDSKRAAGGGGLPLS